MTASQEPEANEDVKPKLNLHIAHEGEQITVKVKQNMKFAKIFEAVEKRFSKDPGTFKFVYQGERLKADNTPAEFDMEDGDQIDAFLAQVGGGLLLPCHSS
ncbi:hypothetical protein D9619_008733 [Psilocybe cf. subviscida]|uniref:Ubiquitin-like domain-containing protein n=1 Tax=Psilocybe cf. subviscida TaxID=2480587 RepID=A0A8H5F162_9AGAR|nr:hypothetical protein D9619_008733 [Psilocybe cf. subviscida]